MRQTDKGDRPCATHRCNCRFLRRSPTVGRLLPPDALDVTDVANGGRLVRRGLLRKVHGGAVRAQTAAKATFSLRLSGQAHEKQRFAETAAGLFQRGDSLVLFSGTTTMALATVLARESGLTFVTNSVDIAANLWRGPGRNQVHLLGGEYHGDDFETIVR